MQLALASGIVAFILNRRKHWKKCNGRNDLPAAALNSTPYGMHNPVQVSRMLDIKELLGNGYDVTEERKQFRKSNRLLGGAAFVVILASIALSILAVLAFIAFIDGLFSW